MIRASREALFYFSPGNRGGLELKREKIFGGNVSQTKDVLTLQRVKVPKYTPGSTVSLRERPIHPPSKARGNNVLCQVASGPEAT